MRTQPTLGTLILLAAVSSLGACAEPATNSGGAQTANAPRQEGAAAASPVQREAAAQSASGNLNPQGGQEVGHVYEAFLSPHQQPGEEKDTPAMTPQQFKSTAPSLLRSERKGRGHGVLRFTNDLSRVYVEVRVENVDPKEVNLFHIHCGKPDLLGPILVDFAHATDIQQNLADGVFTVEITNEHIEKTAQAGHGLVGHFFAGCSVVPGGPEKVKTVAGMEHIARQGELYFNLHTRGQTYYGDIRGKVRPQAAPAK